ncbi:MAG TPA: VWA domain-containing protein [Bryobacteraceae bacterium]|nr:VWA domain-containing protein [Bryobacteraceae bacterium]
MKTARFIVPLFLLIPVQIFPQNGDFKISTNVDLVLLDVSVKDSKGAYVTNLTKDNFKIEENGIPQKITSFQNVDVPVAAGLILDASGSMRNKRSDVNTAGLAFIDASNPEDQIFLLDFNDRVLPDLPEDVTFTGDISLLRMGLSMHTIEGRTVLYDAIIAGLDHLELAERDKKTLVVVTDGGDNASKHTLAQFMQALQKSHATVYTVGIFDEDDPDRNPGVLQRIARVSGGQCFLLSRPEDIIPTSRKIAEDIRKRYTIGYIPDRGNSKIGLRHIHVTATARDGSHLVVTTRTSYADPRPAVQ